MSAIVLTHLEGARQTGQTTALSAMTTLLPNSTLVVGKEKHAAQAVKAGARNVITVGQLKTATLKGRILLWDNTAVMALANPPAKLVEN